MAERGALLIVNADDYGYFRCVSEGIADAHRHGVLNATAVLANLSRFEDDLPLLKSLPDLDVGAHLNFTTGRPLSKTLSDKLSRYEGEFPSKIELVRLLAGRSISAQDVADEWRLQIERCVDAGLDIRFLNSHEHMHMLPGLFQATEQLARAFNINHIRVADPDPIQWLRPASLVRDLPLALLSRRARQRFRGNAARFLGMGESGRLSLDYLERWIPRLEAGKIYELMCHPGYYDPEEIRDPDLLDYHDWRSEFDVLTDPSLMALLNRHGVILQRYRDLGADVVS